MKNTVWFALGVLASILASACGSSGSGTGGSSTTALATIGDDCSADSMCASGLCDDKASCAAPVATLDGGACTIDADCPTGDHCHTATGKCFSNAQDGTGTHSCTTNADCPSDETCGTNHLCAG
jgi:hypothetical protein